MPALRRQFIPLACQLAGLGFLLRGEVLPHFSAVQPALLLLRGQVIEVLQPIFQALLLLRWKLTELRLVLQGLLLLCQRKIPMRFQPCAYMPRLTGLRWTRHRTLDGRAGLCTPGLWRPRNFASLCGCIP